ncbi:glucosaminidase domain-containing protein [Atopococcus tabaci]|uniref:glucosaminidase domain-containing protein n=1 Tax=Atopococcus tabaci TaxID=269774 RepID=UPI00042190F5|nr:glucosaminidase domain-containing protein [Atopococcus tabaci]
MKRKKLVSVLMSSALLFTTGAPTVLAAPLDENVLLASEEETSLFLAELISKADGDNNIDGIGDIKLTFHGETVHISGTVDNAYTVSLEMSFEESLVFESGSQLDVQLSLEDLTNEGTVLKVTHTETEENTLEADLSDLFDSYIASIEEDAEPKEESGQETEEVTDELDSTVIDTEAEEKLDNSEKEAVSDSAVEQEDNTVSDQEESEEETIEEELAEEIVEEEIEEEATEEENVEKDTEAAEEEELAEEPIEEEYHEIKEYESPSSEHSFPRESGVDEILHGDEQSETEEAPAPRMRMFSTFGARRLTAASDGTYTVKRGDTFSLIASSFNLSVRQLQEWNSHVTNINVVPVGTRLAVTRRGVEEMLSPSDKARLYKGGATSQFSTPQEFIDEIAPRAIQVANQEGREGLWPSLMIAQAAHESNYGRSSLGSAPYHNLSGIKGSHNGKSVLMWTWEVYGGQRVNVLANFRHYPSYDASLQDYANLLRNGLSWNRRYYAGTWRSNTNSVWDVLNNNGLKGYATDPNYYAAIRRIINQYDLTQYDTGNHYYVRTGTFLGKEFTTIQMNRLKAENGQYSYRIERDENKAPYSYRRIQSTKDFLGEAGAQRVIDQLRREKGWSASMVPSGNSTQRHRVRSGFFNTLREAERALKQFENLSGYSATIVHGSDGKYRIRTGFFNGRSSAQSGVDYMKELGWSAFILESTDSTPHYYVRTGTFNTPNHVNRATDYFNQNGWGSKPVLDSKNNYYYRIYIEGFHNHSRASSYVSHLKNKYNWGSTAFLVED